MGFKAALTCALVLAVAPASARTVTYRVGNLSLSFGSVQLEVPDSWSSVLQSKESPSGLAVQIEPPGDKPFALLVTPMPLVKPAGPAGRCEEMRSLAERIRSNLLEIAEESDVPLRKLSGSHACGFYATVTDRTVETPTLEDFKYGTQGYAVNGHAMVSFTVLTNLRDPPELATALEIVGSMRHVGLPERSKTAMSAIRLGFPEKRWGLVVDLDGFVYESAGQPQDRPGMRIVATEEALGVNVSIFLEPDTRKDSAEGYRKWYREEHVRPLGESKPFDVSESDRNGMPVVEYSHTVPKYDVKMRHMNAFLVHDGVWIDVHVSKAPYSSADRAHFNAIFDSVKITDEQQ